MPEATVKGMENSEIEALGRRALTVGFQLIGQCVDGDSGLLVHFLEDVSAAWPDLRDAATEGILAAQVRDAYGDDTLHLAVCSHPSYSSGICWSVHSFRRMRLLGKGASRQEAWVGALEAKSESRHRIAVIQALKSGNEHAQKGK